MTAKNYRLKVITFSLGATNFECQVKTWKMTNKTPTGAQMYTFCSSGVFREQTTADWELDITFFSDWTSGGISDFLYTNDQTDALFQLDHHPDITGEHVRWSGTCRVVAPDVGGAYGDTEESTVTLGIFGVPVYARI
jgi:hypothetical protein